MSKPRSQFRRRLEDAIIERFCRRASSFAQRASLLTLRRVTDGCAGILLMALGRRRRQAIADVAAVFPELSETARRRIVRDSASCIGRTMAEMLRLPVIAAGQMRELVPLPQAQMIREALADRGIILLTAHCGNWEYLVARLAQEVPVAAVARDFRSEVAAKVVNDARRSHSIEVIARDDVKRMVQVLRAWQVLAILPDQRVLQGAVLTDFLGRPAWVARGPAVLAARTGAIVLPMFCWRKPDGTFGVEDRPPLELAASADREADVVENTRRITAVIGEAIRRHPEQWLWMHDRWRR